MRLKDKQQQQQVRLSVTESSDLSWLQTLYEFELLGADRMASGSGTRQASVMGQIMSMRNDSDIEVQQMPKVLDKLYELFTCTSSIGSGGGGEQQKQKQQRRGEQLNTVENANPLVYVPNPNKNEAIKAMTTSDFSQLQSVLNQSDSVLSRKAYHPEYAQYQARLDSYKEWPASMSQQPADLAKAGFYYFGIKVYCFH